MKYYRLECNKDGLFRITKVSDKPMRDTNAGISLTEEQLEGFNPEAIVNFADYLPIVDGH